LLFGAVHSTDLLGFRLPLKEAAHPNNAVRNLLSRSEANSEVAVGIKLACQGG
jgi:hypothetical protein